MQSDAACGRRMGVWAANHETYIAEKNAGTSGDFGRCTEMRWNGHD
nr:MAG TPA: hypothetical protein [Caudoviricetes sp.]